jgi:hypothetical protein
MNTLSISSKEVANGTAESKFIAHITGKDAKSTKEAFTPPMKANKTEAKTETSKAKTETSKAVAKTSKAVAKPAQTKAPILAQVPTVSERLERLEKFQQAAKKYNLLKDKEKELVYFQNTQSGILGHILLVCEGAEVKISKTEVIEKVLNVCLSELAEHLAKAEEEIKNFNI